jgi:hypothetical protein
MWGCSLTVRETKLGFNTCKIQDMRTHIFVRIASIIALVYCIGHMSGFPWTPNQDPEASRVVEAMQVTTFDAEGVSRTYWDFYVGFGLIIGAFLLFQTVALWQVSSLMKNEVLKSIPILISFFLSFGINAILSWKFFFAVPAILSISIAACVALAIVFSYRKYNAERFKGTV